MKKNQTFRICISMMLLIIPSLTYGQQFKDRIITWELDTIECNIIEIADQKVHFSFLNYSRVQTSNLPLSEIQSFKFGPEGEETTAAKPEEARAEEPVISPYAKTSLPAPTPATQTEKDPVQALKDQTFNKAVQDAGAELVAFKRQYYNGMLTSFLGTTTGTIIGLVVAIASPELGLMITIAGTVVSLVGSIQMLTSFRHIGEAGEYLLYGTQEKGTRPGSY
jgi:hypothetical protein